MDNAKTTPKDFFMWAGAMVALYWSVVAFLGLVFDYINYSFPNALLYYPSDPYQGGISYEMASLIVLFPLFVLLMRLIHNDILKDPSRKNIWVRRWALFLTLFIAGATMAGDLIWLLAAFLNGTDFTTQFLLKALVVFLVAAAGFMHFLADFKGYWETYPRRAHMVGYAAGALVLVTIVAGFFIVGTPAQARLARLDADKINNLQQIQSEVVNYWVMKRALPQSLATLEDPIRGTHIPVDAQTNAPYEYKVKSALTFELCATFNRVGDTTNQGPYATPLSVYDKGMMSGNWQHTAGRVCFERTIDPDLYPTPAR